MLELEADFIDQHTAVLYLEVPASKVALFQAYFDLYEGLATVRTLDSANSLVCLMATPDSLEDCLRVLASLQAKLEWRPARLENKVIREQYLTDFKNRGN